MHASVIMFGHYGIKECTIRRTVVCASTRWPRHDNDIARPEEDRNRLKVSRKPADEEDSGIS